MAWYVVKDGGTATGDNGRYATQPTGSFATLGAANYYASITAANAATTSPAANDFIIISDLHSNISAASKTFLGIDPPSIIYISVDDANMENGRTSGNRAAIGTTGSSSDLFINNAIVSGMDLSTGDNIALNSQAGCIVQDCTFSFAGSSDALAASGDGQSGVIIDSDINFLHAEGNVLIAGGSVLTILGGSITKPTGGHITSGGFTAGGGNLYMKGVDCSTIDNVLFKDVGATSANDDTIEIFVDLCQLASGVAFTNEEFASTNHRLIIQRSSDSDATAEYQYHIHAFGGDLNQDTSKFRGEDEAFPISSQKISYEIITNSSASLGSPFWFIFPDVKGIQLSAVANKKIALSITSAVTLTDLDVYIRVTYPDGTNYAVANRLLTCPVNIASCIDYMATGTELDTDTGSSWTGALANEYIMEVDTASLAGSDSTPEIIVYVTKPSTTFYISSEPQVS